MLGRGKGFFDDVGVGCAVGAAVVGTGVGVAFAGFGVLCGFGVFEGTVTGGGT